MDSGKERKIVHFLLLARNCFRNGGLLFCGRAGRCGIYSVCQPVPIFFGIFAALFLPVRWLRPSRKISSRDGACLNTHFHPYGSGPRTGSPNGERWCTGQWWEQKRTPAPPSPKKSGRGRWGAEFGCFPFSPPLPRHRRTSLRGCPDPMIWAGFRLRVLFSISGSRTSKRKYDFLKNQTRSRMT